VSIRTSTARLTTASLLLLLVFAAIAAGCSSEPSGQATTTASDAGVASSTTATQSATTTTSPLQLSDYDRELAKTATIQHQLAVYLDEQQVSQGDPRIALIYGLRARVQALTCRNALDKGDLALADLAMKDVYSTLNLGGNVATGTTATILADARAIIDTLGAPSDAPGQAAVLIDRFIAQLAPLLDEATAITPSTTST
jgi:hypothetical protein